MQGDGAALMLTTHQLEFARGWPLAVAAILLSGPAVAVYARRRAGAATVEQFVARAETRSGLTASAYSLDYRTAALTYRAARPSAEGRSARVRRPARPRLVVIWRDALALIRDRSRLGWAVVIAAAGALEVLSHPARTVPAALSAALYFAASLLCASRSGSTSTTPTAMVITRHAVAHHRPVVGPAVVAWTLSGACAVMLLARARRAARPG